jgi:hypothetical protein
LMFLAGLSATISYAQQGTTFIGGVVTDPQGAAITGAKVTAVDASSGVNRSTTTDEQGRFQFPSLQPGTYSVRVEAQGFRAAVNDKVEALVSTNQNLTIKLELGAVSDTVEVTESTVAPVNTTDATIGNTFDSRQILALPFEGRDAAGVLSLQPGITFIGKNVDDNVDTRNGSLNGGRSDQANITLDGVDNNDQVRGTAFQGAVRSTLDSIEEFRVTTIGDNADQGRSSGGQVTLVTKSGTNQFHGSLYEQNRPTVTAANGWFNKHTELENGQPNTPQKIIRNTYGGALGGPIIKDRLFFFGTYEALRQAEDVEVSRNVPGLTLRAGQLAYPTAAGGTQVLSSAQIASMDPNCTGLGTCPLGAGPDPAAVAQFNKYPLPNSSSCINNDGFNISCYSFSAPNPKNLNTSIAKLDYNLNRAGTHRLFIRGNYQTDRTALPPQFPGQPPANVIRDTSRALAVGYTGVLTNNLVNSFHYGFTRQSSDNDGIETAPLVSFRFIDDLVPGVSSVSPQTSFTTKFHVPVHNWVDDLTWTRGKHTLQFGTNVRLINNVRASDASNFNNGLVNPDFLPISPAGSGGSLDPAAFGFPAVDPNNTGVYNDDIVDLVGVVTQVTGSFNRDKNNNQFAQGALVPRHFRSWEYEWYVQDVWHIKSNLTITAGLRYDLSEPPYETNGNQVAPDISLSNFVNTRAALAEQGQIFSPTFGLGLSGQANGKQPYWPWDYKNLGPRLAVAYSPNPSGGLLKALFGGGGKSSIRAGYGIVYDHFGEGLVNTFDAAGSFGLTTIIENPASVQTIDGGARFTGVHEIPTASLDGPLLGTAPNGPFPFIPPVSTIDVNTQQIAYSLDDKLHTPYSELVDFSVTRELPAGFVLEVAYVGRFAHRLLQQRDLAMPVDLKDPKSGTDYFSAADAFGRDFYAGVGADQIKPIAFWENLFPGAAGTCGANTTATQCMYQMYQGNIGPGTFGETNGIFNFDSFCFPACLNQQPGAAPGASGKPGGPFQFYNPQFAALYAWSSIGKSAYNAMQVILRSRPTHGLQMDFNYSFSQSLDVCSDAERVPTFGGLCAVVNTWAPNQLRAPSDFDARHQINSNWVYDLPVGRNKHFGHDWNRAVDAVLGGWQVSGLVRVTSGFPFSVTPGQTFPTNFQLSGNVFNIRPVSTGTSFLGPTGEPYAFKLGPAADTTLLPGVTDPNFRYALAGESGQRNNFRGDGFFGLDMGVNKTFHFTERQTLRFSASAFNLTNTVRFDPATISASVQNSATFGQYSQTLTNPRVMEFALRYQF